jgi:hypothetical protein
VQPARDFAHANALSPQQADLLSLLKRQIPPGDRLEHERRHAATLAEPSAAGRARRADRDCRFLA